jgi:hypothetical protein
MTGSGADSGFQVRRGALKQVAPNGGWREHFWGISCEKSRFYTQKILFFPIILFKYFHYLGYNLFVIHFKIYHYTKHMAW